MLPCRPADVGVGGQGLGERDGERLTGVGGLDDLVDHAEVERGLDATGDPLVLGGELRLDLRAEVGVRPRAACAGAGSGPRRPRP